MSNTFSFSLNSIPFSQLKQYERYLFYCKKLAKERFFIVTYMGDSEVKVWDQSGLEIKLVGVYGNCFFYPLPPFPA
jgi:hypothetical protein